ncbi:heavy-metal-associated domain-containing protein [Jannaschia formosa]|uniref:heavy-metal-associated domain-containing protein n=1 Tax=Jannaschia formosa TaxID=2259592 RepID=UPI000E1C225D|nr:cation transporter [Jannaschia formosa]TFL17411.1 copper chaperone [Jannaschia formosa]
MDFKVQGMTCGHCERAVTQAVRRLDPDAAVTVDRVAGRVSVESRTDAQAIRKAIEDEGYPVSH